MSGIETPLSDADLTDPLLGFELAKFDLVPTYTSLGGAIVADSDSHNRVVSTHEESDDHKPQIMTKPEVNSIHDLPGDLELLTSNNQSYSSENSTIPTEHRENPRVHAKIPVYAISLERDTDRRQAIIAQAKTSSDIELHFVAAVDGSQLSKHICTALVRDGAWASNRGTIGCFLSHIKAWEAVASGDDEWAVIIEDDVEFRAVSTLQTLQLPEDAEIVFLNDRMVAIGSASDLRVLPLFHALLALDQVRSGGPGGDGYFLKRSAAQTLLKACASDLYYGHVDGRLLRYATHEDDLSKLSNDSWIAGVIRKHHHYSLVPKLGLIRGYCLSKPLVRHRGVSSSREAVDRVEISMAKTTSGDKDSHSEKGAIAIRFWNRIANIGDSINPYVIEAVSGQKPVFCGSDLEPHLLGVGSILFMATPASHVWGSGILDPSTKIPTLNPSNVHAVRGHLTRDLLASHYKLPAKIALGDPGFLIGKIPEVQSLRRDSVPSCRFGIIPHFAVQNSEKVRELTRRLNGEVISPATNSLAFIERLLSCEIVVSQSLHGLIFAEALGKPWVWLSDDNSPIWTFKFHDWFSNLQAPPSAPMPFSGTAQDVLALSSMGGMKSDVAELCEAIPTPISRKPSGLPFRYCRQTIPFRIAFQSGFTVVANDMDGRVHCEIGDEAALRAQLNAFSRLWDEPRPTLLAFDPDLAGLLKLRHLAQIVDLFTAKPLLHFVVITPPSLDAVVDSEGGISGADFGLRSWRSDAAWRGVVVMRSASNFSFSAPGAIISFSDMS